MNQKLAPVLAHGAGKGVLPQSSAASDNSSLRPCNAPPPVCSQSAQPLLHGVSQPGRPPLGVRPGVVHASTRPHTHGTQQMLKQPGHSAQKSMITPPVLAQQNRPSAALVQPPLLSTQQKLQPPFQSQPPLNGTQQLMNQHHGEALSEKPFINNLHSALGKEEEVKPIDQPQEYEGMQLYPDQFVGSQLVLNLKENTFSKFVQNKDVTMVMFYDPSNCVSTWSKMQFATAAQLTKRTNHAFAAVNCCTDSGLCCSEAAKSTPYFKLYTKGFNVTSIDDAANFRARDMQIYVERSPVMRPFIPKVETF